MIAAPIPAASRAELHETMARAQLREIFRLAAVHDRHAVAADRRIEELLARGIAAGLEDARAEHEFVVADLCALLAPAALERARELAAIEPTAGHLIEDLDDRQAVAFLQPLFAAAGMQGRLFNPAARARRVSTPSG